MRVVTIGNEMYVQLIAIYFWSLDRKFLSHKLASLIIFRFMGNARTKYTFSINIIGQLVLWVTGGQRTSVIPLYLH